MKHQQRAKGSRFSILYSWTLFFVLLLTVSISVSWFIYGNAVQSIKGEVEKSYDLELDRIKFLIDEKLGEMKRIALEQSLNTDLQQLLRMNTVTPQSRIAMWQLQRRLKDYCVSNSFINDIVIGFNDADRAISNRSVYSIKEVSDIVLDGTLLNQLQRREYKNKYILLENKKNNSPAMPMIIYLLSLPLESGSSNNSFVLITMRADKLAQLLSAYGNRGIMIGDGSTDVYVSGGEQVDASEFGSQDFKQFLARSDIEGLGYKYYVPVGEFIGKINSINGSMVISLAACVVLFAVILTAFIRKNYNPIHRMLMRINEQLHNSSQQSKNELAYIEGSLGNIFDERQSMIGELTRKESELRGFLLSKLLTGDAEDREELTESIGWYGMESRSGGYVVLITEIPSPDCALDEGVALHPTDLSLYLAKKALGEVYGPSLADCMSIDNCVAAILSGQRDNKQEMQYLLAKYMDALAGVAGPGVRAAASSCVDSLAEIARAYQQAREAMEYCALLARDAAIYEKGLAGIKVNLKQISDINKRLGNCIAAGDFGEAAVLLQDAFDASFSPLFSVSTLKLHVYGLIHLISSSLSDFATKGCMQIEIDGIAYRMLSCRSIVDLRHGIESELNTIAREFREFQAQQTSGLVEKVIEYISANYSRYDLSVGGIADKFCISVPYLSRAFKKEASTGLLEYIHSIRIHEAKKLLAAGGYSIGEIASAVGFSDSSVFIKVFKKQEGLPPGRYTKSSIALL